MATEIDLTPPDPVVDTDEHIRWLIENFEFVKLRLGIGEGISGTFTTVDGKTVTVENGIVKSII